MASSAGAALAALVSISVAPDVPPELSQAAVRSCDTALGEGKCVLERTQPVVAEWRATVTSADASLGSVRVDVHRDAPGAPTETRELTFAPEDAARERWASVGVLIAALVVSESRAVETTPPASSPRAPSSPPKAALAKKPSARPLPVRLLRFDLRGVLARRTGAGSPEVGAELSASVLPPGGPWFGAVSFAGAHRFGTGLDASWLSAALMAGARVGKPTATWATEFRAGALGDYWYFEASEPGRSENTGKLRFGGLVGADVLWALHPRWILSLGVEGLLASPRLRVEIEGRTVETIPEYGALVAAGVRFFP